MVVLSTTMDQEESNFDFVRNGLTDRVLRGLRIQDKCAHMATNGIKMLSCRLANGVKSWPYVYGDNDVYMVHFVTTCGSVYLRWSFPQEVMLDHRIISKIDADGTIVEVGSGALSLAIASGNNDPPHIVALQLAVCGGWPRTNSSMWTAGYLDVMRIV